DVNFSEWDCTLEKGEWKVKSEKWKVKKSEVDAPAAAQCAPDSSLSTFHFSLSTLRLGFRLIKGMPEALARAIAATRSQGRFRSVTELARRVGLGRPLLARLAAADALGSLGLSRRMALWQVLALGEELPLFAALEDEPEPLPPLAEMSLEQHVVADYETTGLSLKAHPISLVRAELERLQVAPASALTEMADKDVVRVAGLVLVRQQPSTSKGTIFMTLEDETGIVNVVVWPRVWQRFRAAVRGAVAVLVEGK